RAAGRRRVATLAPPRSRTKGGRGPSPLWIPPSPEEPPAAALGLLGGRAACGPFLWGAAPPRPPRASWRGRLRRLGQPAGGASLRSHRLWRAGRPGRPAAPVSGDSRGRLGGGSGAACWLWVMDGTLESRG